MKIKKSAAILIAAVMFLCGCVIDLPEDVKTYEVVIPFQFDFAGMFRNGLAVVEIDGKKGLINTSGDFIVPPIYDEIGNFFNEGLTQVRLGGWDDGKWGFIDKTGEVVIPIIYDWVGSFFRDGVVPVAVDGKFGLIDTRGNEVVPLIFDGLFTSFSEGLLPVQYNELWGFIDYEGDVVIPFEFDIVTPFENGLSMVTVVVPELSWPDNFRFGFIDTEGNVVVPIIYSDAHWFIVDIAWVATGSWPNRKWGAVNRTGEVVIPFIYDFVTFFTEDLTIVTQGFEEPKSGVVDSAGNVVVPVIYGMLRHFADGVLIFGRDRQNIDGVVHFGVSGLIDTEGNEIILPEGWRFLGGLSSEGLAPVAYDGHMGFINTAGELVIPFQFYYSEMSPEGWWMNYDFRNGFAIVHTEDWLFGIIDAEGNIVVPLIYYTTWGFHEGTAAVMRDDKWGFVDKSGNEVVPLYFDNVQPFGDGLAAVKRGGKWGFIALISEEVRGNTASNIVNGGFAAIQGDWIYYIYDNNFGIRDLMRIRVDGSDVQRLTGDVCSFINVIGDNVFFRNAWGRLYRIRADGTGGQNLTDDNVNFINVIGNYVYFTTDWPASRLYRMRTDGTERQRLTDDRSADINVVGEWVYYVNLNWATRPYHGGPVYKIRRDGTERQRLTDDRTRGINVADGFVYYSNASSSHRLYRIRADGTDRQRLSNNLTFSINVSGGWVYGLGLGGEGALIYYRVRKDGTGEEIIAAGTVDTGVSFAVDAGLNIVGDFVYFFEIDRLSPDDWNLFLFLTRMRTDGTERQRVWQSYNSNTEEVPNDEARYIQNAER